ncbi:hypothetical protein JD844_003456, partial [Phrynosoma platyrhinos]
MSEYTSQVFYSVRIQSVRVQTSSPGPAQDSVQGATSRSPSPREGAPAPAPAQPPPPQGRASSSSSSSEPGRAPFSSSSPARRDPPPVCSSYNMPDKKFFENLSGGGKAIG